MVERRLHRHLCAAAVACALLPAQAGAESRFETSASVPVKAAAHLDFTIVVPKVAYLRIGTGLAGANSDTVDAITFTVPAEQVGNGSAVASGSGPIVARVIGNNGPMTLSASTQGPLGSGGDATISWSQIGVAVAADTTPTTLGHPPLVDGGTNSIGLPTTRGNITDLDARWTFIYANRAVLPAGTYGGLNTHNGRVVYSLSMP